MAIKLFFLLVAVSYVTAITFPASEGPLNRITNAPLATDTQFPYVISLQQISMLPDHVQAHRCGGALITLQHALTLASCVYTIVNDVQQPLQPSQYRVFAGGAHLSSDSADRSRTIANFTQHPDHIQYPSSINDIAVITTTQPFPNTTVFPIPLPAANDIPADFTLCNVAGWGAPNNTVLASNELRFTTKYIYKNDTCTIIWNMMPTSANILPSMICAASFDVISSGCYGDQGNGLTCNGQLTGLLFLTNSCQLSSFPEVYTRVSNYVPWIRSITGAANTFKPEFSVLTLIAFVSMKIFS